MEIQFKFLNREYIVYSENDYEICKSIFHIFTDNNLFEDYLDDINLDWDWSVDYVVEVFKNLG